jgi:hypothetical protein
MLDRPHDPRPATPLAVRAAAALLSVQVGTLLFAATATVISLTAASSCFVWWVVGGLGGFLVLLILWPLAGFLVVIAHNLNRLEPWARIAFHVAYVAIGVYGTDLVIVQHVQTAVWLVACAVVALVLVSLPSSRRAFAARGTQTTAMAGVGSGVAQVLNVGSRGDVFNARYHVPNRGLGTQLWADVWVAVIRDPWARWVSVAAVVLATVTTWASLPPPRPGPDGLPQHPSQSFVAARPEANLVAPGASVYVTQIDGSGCGSQADAYIDAASPQRMAVVSAWYDSWLTAHGWKREPASAIEQEAHANGYPDSTYKRGVRETFTIEYWRADLPPFHGGAQHTSMPPSTVSTFEASYVIRAGT